MREMLLIKNKKLEINKPFQSAKVYSFLIFKLKFVFNIFKEQL